MCVNMTDPTILSGVDGSYVHCTFSAQCAHNLVRFHILNRDGTKEISVDMLLTLSYSLAVSPDLAVFKPCFL
jgi:hypothetical protein